MDSPQDERIKSDIPNAEKGYPEVSSLRIQWEALPLQALA